MKTKKDQNAKQDNGKDERNDPIASKASTPTFISFLEEISLLEEEDSDSYQEVFGSIVSETNTNSFLGFVAAKDFADKLFDERRYRTAIVDVISAARMKAMLAPEDERALEITETYVPLLTKFDRMINSSQASRRALLREFRQSASDKSSIEPPSPPKTNKTN